MKAKWLISHQVTARVVQWCKQEGPKQGKTLATKIKQKTGQFSKKKQTR